MLTKRKRLYAKARLDGKNQTDSAIFAGCPAKTAAQAASRYEKDPDVITLIGGADVVEKLPRGNTVPPNKEVYRKPPAPSAEGKGDSLDYLRRVMWDEAEETRYRLDAAKALAAYEHAKQGEKGKMELKKESAEKAHSKFKQAAAPVKLTRVS